MKSFPKIAERSIFRASRLAALLLMALACTSIALAGPIHDAARKGDVKKVQALLASDPKLVNDKDNKGDTPLHVAALHGQLNVVQALIDAGADVNAKNNYAPFTPGDLWPFLSPTNHPDPVALLSLHAQDMRDTQNGYSPLDLASFSARYMPIVQLLVAKGANVNAQSSSGASALFWAVVRDQKDEAKFLIDHGADVNAADAYGDTILDIVLHLQYTSILQMLLDKNVDVNALDQSQHRPLTYALQMDDHKWADILRKKGAHE
ncbi:MAG: ankyrin repeat domain-containing protein [Terracidiphilus sp.]|jgi:ankyrin repeat protein